MSDESAKGDTDVGRELRQLQSDVELPGPLGDPFELWRSCHNAAVKKTGK